MRDILESILEGRNPVRVSGRNLGFCIPKEVEKVMDVPGGLPLTSEGSWTMCDCIKDHFAEEIKWAVELALRSVAEEVVRRCEGELTRVVVATDSCDTSPKAAAVIEFRERLRSHIRSLFPTAFA